MPAAVAAAKWASGSAKRDLRRGCSNLSHTSAEPRRPASPIRHRVAAPRGQRGRPLFDHDKCSPGRASSVHDGGLEPRTGPGAHRPLCRSGAQHLEISRKRQASTERDDCGMRSTLRLCCRRAWKRDMLSGCGLGRPITISSAQPRPEVATITPPTFNDSGEMAGCRSDHDSRCRSR